MVAAADSIAGSNFRTIDEGGGGGWHYPKPPRKPKRPKQSNNPFPGFDENGIPIKPPPGSWHTGGQTWNWQTNSFNEPFVNPYGSNPYAGMDFGTAPESGELPNWPDFVTAEQLVQKITFMQVPVWAVVLVSMGGITLGGYLLTAPIVPGTAASLASQGIMGMSTSTTFITGSGMVGSSATLPVLKGSGVSMTVRTDVPDLISVLKTAHTVTYSSESPVSGSTTKTKIEFGPTGERKESKQKKR